MGTSSGVYALNHECACMSYVFTRTGYRFTKALTDIVKLRNYFLL